MAANREKRGKKKTGEEEEPEIPRKIQLLTSGLRQSSLFKAAMDDEIPPRVGVTQSALFGPVPRSLICISSLTAGNYATSELLGRVCLVSEGRDWSNGRTQGRALSFHLADSTGELAITLFDDQVTRFESMLVLNSVLKVSGFRVKQSHPNYLRIPGQTLEATVDSKGTLANSTEECCPIKFEFSDITEIATKDAGSIIDFVGIVYDDEGLISGQGRNDKPFAFRKILGTDRTKCELKLKIWGPSAEKFVINGPTSVVVRRATVEVYEGEKCVTVGHSSLFWLNPDLAEAEEIMAWLSSETK